jgi:hypothetical protein
MFPEHLRNGLGPVHRRYHDFQVRKFNLCWDRLVSPFRVPTTCKDYLISLLLINDLACYGVVVNSLREKLTFTITTLNLTSTVFLLNYINKFAFQPQQL